MWLWRIIFSINNLHNLDKKTVNSFSNEWNKFQQDKLSDEELLILVKNYFDLFPLDNLKKNYEVFDMGCGTGRWAKFVAPKVNKLNCIDPSLSIKVAKKNLKDFKNINFINESIDNVKLKKNSQDFGYSLGVLHHIPNTKKALIDCVNLLKPGAPLLIYIYYAFDNKPFWFKLIWKSSDILRKFIILLPSSLKNLITDLIAVIIYFPLAKISLILEKFNKKIIRNFPLSYYRHSSFYTMRTDARDRFGTPLEKRFTKIQIKKMMTEAGLIDIKFSETEPFWCSLGYKKSK